MINASYSAREFLLAMRLASAATAMLAKVPKANIGRVQATNVATTVTISTSPLAGSWRKLDEVVRRPPG